jgi:hypothetical protein
LLQRPLLSKPDMLRLRTARPSAVSTLTERWRDTLSPAIAALSAHGDSDVVHGSSVGTGTTTVTFGTLSDTSSKVCFNTKNSAGQDMSFYFNSDFQMAIAQTVCQ